MAKFDIYDPILYPRYLWVGTGNLKELLSKFKYKNGEPLQRDDLNTSFGITFDEVCQKGSNQLGVLIYLNENTNISQWAHEAIHAAHGIFNALNIHYTMDDDEHFTYFVQWIVESIQAFFINNVRR